ncbi:hypothetical protein N7507_007657 [Penicillium longicatenatum]|nr:hypothetical protein N7507_007657 [Penicillium longicatenatum]
MSIDSDILSTGADSSGIDFVVQSQNGIRKLRMRFWRGRRVEGTCVTWKHDSPGHVCFGSTVQKAAFDEFTGTPVMTVVETGSVYQK